MVNRGNSKRRNVQVGLSMAYGSSNEETGWPEQGPMGEQ